jgi:ubiquinone/menaquinone biosynthesis C-methylase UbiE
MTDEHEVASWDRYWEQGLLHSCANAFAGNYEGPIDARWRGWFAALPPGSRVVDIGTGNGAIAAIAASVSREQGTELEIHGVDLADIDPMRTVADAATVLSGIVFHPRTSAAQMPFEEASVDAVCGQYALEYTPVEDVLSELARVLKPGGRAGFIIHHTASVILETTRADLAHTDLILGKKGVLEAADRMLKRMDTAGADAARAAFNKAAAGVTAAIQGTRYPDLLQSLLGHLGQILEGVRTQQPKDLRRQVAGLRREVEANRVRLLDLAGAAMDGPQMADLVESLTARGFAAATPELIRHDPQRLMGWWMSLER